MANLSSPRYGLIRREENCAPKYTPHATKGVLLYFIFHGRIACADRIDIFEKG